MHLYPPLSSNRTFMELKQKSDFSADYIPACSNRTFMELKLIPDFVTQKTHIL